MPFLTINDPENYYELSVGIIIELGDLVCLYPKVSPFPGSTLQSDDIGCRIPPYGMKYYRRKTGADPVLDTSKQFRVGDVITDADLLSDEFTRVNGLIPSNPGTRSVALYKLIEGLNERIEALEALVPPSKLNKSIELERRLDPDL